MKYCCPNCFIDDNLKSYVHMHASKHGKCNYCSSKKAALISTKEMGEHILECLKNCYENADDGTGAMHNEGVYVGADGKEADLFSTREILLYEHPALADKTLKTSIIDDLFSELDEDGEFNSFSSVDDEVLVVKEDLYCGENTTFNISWESFKHIVRHYCRFFDVDRSPLRKYYLTATLAHYLSKYSDYVYPNKKFYRCREINKNLEDIHAIDPYKELSPAPPAYAKTNRMSPAGISYLYLSSDKETAYSECRLAGKTALVATFVAKKKLKIADFSEIRLIPQCSIYDDFYEHDSRWLTTFIEKFSEEISMPVDDSNSDHSYEYAATQVVAEFIRSLGYDGICFKSSVADGKSYAFFVGPDIKHTPDAYPYPYTDPYLSVDLPILKAFTEWFDIKLVEKTTVSAKLRTGAVLDKRIV